MMKVSGVTFLTVGLFVVCSTEVLNNVSTVLTLCPEHCKYCNSSDFNCIVCDSGFFGMQCQQECNNCNPGTQCVRDSGFCEVGCKDGFSGNYCNVSCDSKCLSCDRHNPTNCWSCKNLEHCKNIELACPANCKYHSCNGNYCTEGCVPGFWGYSCEEDCPENCSSVGCNRGNGTCPDVSSGTERPASSCAVEVVVSVLSVPLVIMVGVVIFRLILKRKHRHREQKMLVNKFQHTQSRHRATQTDPVEILSNSGSNAVENYDDVMLEGYAISEEPQAEVLREEFTYTYATSLSRTQSQLTYATSLSRTQSQLTTEDKGKPIKDLGNVSGISEESTATSGTTEVQYNAVKLLGNQDPSYFCSLRTDDDLPNRYSPLDKSACTETDNCDYQNKPTAEIYIYTTDETGGIYHEELQQFDYQSSETDNAYITPTV